MAHHGLAHGGDGLGNGRQEPAAPDHDLAVVGAEPLGHQVRVLELVPRLAPGRLEADAEGLEPVLALLVEQGHNERGVDAAREEHAHRDVGHHPPPDRGAERVHERLLPDAGVPTLLVG